MHTGHITPCKQIQKKYPWPRCAWSWRAAADQDAKIELGVVAVRAKDDATTRNIEDEQDKVDTSCDTREELQARIGKLRDKLASMAGSDDEASESDGAACDINNTEMELVSHNKQKPHGFQYFC